MAALLVIQDTWQKCAAIVPPSRVIPQHRLLQNEKSCLNGGRRKRIID